MRTRTGISFMIKCPNFLLIAGTGRNSGKTTMACSIIKKVVVDFPVTGLKISPHFHGGTESLKPLVGNDNFNLYKETSVKSEKDSSKMLQAGASEVFYIETTDGHIKNAFETFTKFIEPNIPVVCESPALRNYIVPGLFFIMDNINNINKKESIYKWKDKTDGFFNLANDKGKERLIKKIQFNIDGWHLT